MYKNDKKIALMHGKVKIWAYKDDKPNEMDGKFV